MTLRRRNLTRRAMGDLTGRIRWVLVDPHGRPQGRTTYPTSQAALSCRLDPAHEPRRCRITGRAGPFHDTIELI